ncbi:hypothetical protein [Parathalassolituus penaei]|uniref:Secreted protein n=1 Tax=Parathalassolituus penaei TaxID=2997323 RepID=A0A9X3EF63_9GAMM|nr:hypothetical protein [Parathalassolituus penaei]MCY0966468.1 hypothetical protein [Parathalassolituus penaei]
MSIQERSVRSVRPFCVCRKLLPLAIFVGVLPTVADAEGVYVSTEQSRLESDEKYLQPEFSLKNGSKRQNWSLVSARVDGANASVESHSEGVVVSSGKASAASNAKNTRGTHDDASTSNNNLTAAQKMFGDGSVVEGQVSSAPVSSASVSSAPVDLSKPKVSTDSSSVADQSTRPTAAEAINRFVMGETGPVVGVSPRVEPVVASRPEKQGSLTTVNPVTKVSANKVATKASTKRVKAEQLEAARKLDTLPVLNSGKNILPEAPGGTEVDGAVVFTQASPPRSTEMFTRDVTGKEHEKLPLTEAEVVPSVLSTSGENDPIGALENRRSDTPLLRSAPAS